VEASITLKNVSKHFHKHYILSNLNLGIEKGSTFAVIGRNGAGKTVLLQTMATMLMPDAGNVFINGEDTLLVNPDLRQIVGYLPDHDMHDPWISGWDNIRLRAELLGLSISKAQDRINSFIRDFNLTEELVNAPVTYARGTKRCLDLVLIILADPEILILDEPTLGLDYHARAVLLRYLSEVKQTKTIVLASNEFNEIQTIADRWIVLDKGMVRFDGTIEKMLTQIEVPFTAELELQKASPQKITKLSTARKIHTVQDFGLTIRVQTETLQDFIEIMHETDLHDIVGIRGQIMRIDEFLNRLLTDEE